MSDYHFDKPNEIRMRTNKGCGLLPTDTPFCKFCFLPLFISGGTESLSSVRELELEEAEAFALSRESAFFRRSEGKLAFRKVCDKQKFGSEGFF